jgi:hypothetical protein
MMQTFKKFFLLPTIITVFLLGVVFYFGNFAALFAVVILIILEVTLSFDNAVVNAKVLEKMDEKWQKRFINWGIWVAVFGTRVLLPIVIVAIVSGLGMLEVLNLAIYDSETYGIKLDEAHYSIGAFGGVFLLLVALKYFIDDNKDIHWIKVLEKRLKKFSSVESIEVVLAMVLLLIIAKAVPAHAVEILIAGVVGCITFVLVEGITSNMGHDAGKVASAGAGLFVYLNILDAAFSLDGVIGAFAISSNLLVIMVGLGVGAYFVRSFTVMLVEKKTLSELMYLEHGAHWAVGGLGVCMLLGLIVHIPEVIIGVIGLCFVAAAYMSSVRHIK